MARKAPDDPEVLEAGAAVMQTGPVPAILDAQEPEGYWTKPGPGYSPKYRATVWQLLRLDKLGADPSDLRVRAACAYVLAHTPTVHGGFGASGAEAGPPPPSSAIHCLNGNLLSALVRLGWLHDPRVQRAIAWQASAITGEDAAFPFFKSRTSGPGFACGVNGGLPCAWGANKAIAALLAIPGRERTAAVERALDAGAEFLLSRDPAEADYPSGGGISSTWFRLGLPLSYWSDFLETLENLVDLGYGGDPRLDRAFALLLSKRRPDGRWRLENTPNRKTWAPIETRGKPSKWVTLRALRTLRKVGREA